MKSDFVPMKFMDLYEIAGSLYIVVGTPFLYYKRKQIIIMSDLHLGQEAVIQFSDEPDEKISSSLVKLVDQLSNVMENHGVKEIIVNGDVKHASSSVFKQEILEFDFFVNHRIMGQVQCIFVKGNHDRLLKFSTRRVRKANFRIVDEYVVDDIYFHHGHELFDPEKAKIIILGHEHPSFRLSSQKIDGSAKLPAFAKICCSTHKDVIILPAANDMSSGTRFPPQTKNDFLSPYLKEHAILESIIVFPFQKDVGMFPIPYPKMN